MIIMKTPKLRTTSDDILPFKSNAKWTWLQDYAEHYHKTWQLIYAKPKPHTHIYDSLDEVTSCFIKLNLVFQMFIIRFIILDHAMPHFA